MNYFDLHCDTLTELYDKGETLENSTCHVSRQSITKFNKYAQVAAVFSKVGKSDDECFKRFFEVCDHFKKRCGCGITKTAEELKKELEIENATYILSVEDARILTEDMGKFREIKDYGVKLITPLWSGVTCIGGAFDTDEGLSPFGKKLVEKLIETGVICDVSHASRKSTAYILDAHKEAGISPIASHSNSFSVFPHPRNLTDGEAEKIADLGGIIGISLAPQHLAAKNASAVDVIKHVERYRRIIGEKRIAFGCDFDGIETTPIGIQSQNQISDLWEEMKNYGFTENFLDQLFFRNAFEFFENNLK